MYGLMNVVREQHNSTQLYNKGVVSIHLESRTQEFLFNARLLGKINFGHRYLGTQEIKSLILQNQQDKHQWKDPTKFTKNQYNGFADLVLQGHVGDSIAQNAIDTVQHRFIHPEHGLSLHHAYQYPKWLDWACTYVGPH